MIGLMQNLAQSQSDQQREDDNANHIVVGEGRQEALRNVARKDLGKFNLPSCKGLELGIMFALGHRDEIQQGPGVKHIGEQEPDGDCDDRIDGDDLKEPTHQLAANHRSHQCF